CAKPDFRRGQNIAQEHFFTARFVRSSRAFSVPAFVLRAKFHILLTKRARRGLCDALLFFAGYAIIGVTQFPRPAAGPSLKGALLMEYTSAPGALAMPAHYVLVPQEEMVYLDGGALFNMTT